MEQKIAAFLKSAHPSSPSSAEEISRSKDLFSDGFLDSLLNLKLIAFVEKEAGVRIPALQVTRKSFSSVSSIAALVNRVRDGG